MTGTREANSIDVTGTWHITEDEMDPVNGGGWLRPVSEQKAEGMIKIHRGDRSRFTAQRAS